MNIIDRLKDVGEIEIPLAVVIVIVGMTALQTAKVLGVTVGVTVIPPKNEIHYVLVGKKFAPIT